MGVGPTELIIIALILLVLFGPTLVAFFLGYTLGKKKAAESPPAQPAPTAPLPSTDPETQETPVDE